MSGPKNIPIFSEGPHGWRLRQQDRCPGHGRTHALGRPVIGDAGGGCHASGAGALGHLLRPRGRQKGDGQGREVVVK